MIFKERLFIIAIIFIIFQQSFLAASTYYIAQAGALLGSGKMDHVLLNISLFFTLALLAYIASSVSTFFTKLAANKIWEKYSISIISLSTQSMSHASENNKKSIAHWLGGEALSTTSQACEFYSEMISSALNIFLTISVFYLAIGWEISSSIMVATVLSLLLSIAVHQKIENIAGEIQKSRLKTLMYIEPAWTCALFGTQKNRAVGFSKLSEKMNLYFSKINKYVLLEQVIACCPILISTLILIGLLQFTDVFTASLAGALVAVLPRSLQVFGNVHSLSVYLSQFFLMHAKLRNLDNFLSGLEKYEMHGTSLQSISVYNTEKQWSPSELMAALQQKNITFGRFKVTGANGSGKSTFLKIIKDTVPDSLLLSPDIHFLDSGHKLSTGQRRIKEIENALALAPGLLMLDEWDANLDSGNRERIDQLLDVACRQIVVIEVLHLGP